MHMYKNMPIFCSLQCLAGNVNAMALLESGSLKSIRLCLLQKRNVHLRHLHNINVILDHVSRILIFFFQIKSSMTSLRRTSVFFFLFIVSLCFVASMAELERYKHPLKTDGSLRFLVVGDWGRRGLYNQSKVATQVCSIF